MKWKRESSPNRWVAAVESRRNWIIFNKKQQKAAFSDEAFVFFFYQLRYEISGDWLEINQVSELNHYQNIMTNNLFLKKNFIMIKNRLLSNIFTLSCSRSICSKDRETISTWQSKLFQKLTKLRYPETGRANLQCLTTD